MRWNRLTRTVFITFLVATMSMVLLSCEGGEEEGGEEETVFSPQPVPTPEPAPTTGPDLVIEELTLSSDGTVKPRGSFSLVAEVTNRGSETAEKTTVSYSYTGADAYFRETEEDADSLRSLDPGEDWTERVSAKAPPVAGAYYYEVCAEPVPNETNDTNNCSPEARLAVTETGWDSYGAIAHDPTRCYGQFFFRYGFSSQARADDDASDACTAGGCRIRFRFKNECAAVAVTLESGCEVLVIRTGDTRTEAENEALDRCDFNHSGSCSILVRDDVPMSACSY